jgi:5'-3' exonuclease
MGIPSYYKKLVDSLTGLVKKSHPDTKVNWLWMDFNCLIYHCLHREDTPAYPGSHDKEAWEVQFVDCIVRYCLKVVKEVQPVSGIFIAIDGVVPMAKMRQQRLRRFKSVWLTDMEASKKGYEDKWDTNAITPGTQFMATLKARLQKMIRDHPEWHWYFSSSDEPGEGEHKIMNMMRKSNLIGNHAIYGLDADLIVLALLHRAQMNAWGSQMWLFRERVEAGEIQRNSIGEEYFDWFSINTLETHISNGWADTNSFIKNYCFAMSILGNDFIPSSLSYKIRDGGNEHLIDILNTILSTSSIHNNMTDGIVVGGTMINSSNNIQIEGVTALFQYLAKDEANRVQRYVNKKMMMARNLGQKKGEKNMAGETVEEIKGLDMGLGENNYPLSHIEEAVLLGEDNRTLHDNWEKRYMKLGFNGAEFTRDNINRICKEYLYGIQWVWNYYIGNMDNICFNWVYTYTLPPLWSWIVEYIKEHGLPKFPGRVQIKAEDIEPVEQLLLVLPRKSYNLVPNEKYRELPHHAPYLFPEKFGFNSTGKRYFWECEAEIPVPSIIEIKELRRLL